MKRTAIILLTLLILSLTACSSDPSDSARLALIDSYVSAVNCGDTEAYISLFTQDNQSEMRAFLENNSTEEFFRQDTLPVTVFTPERIDSQEPDTAVYCAEVTENAAFSRKDFHFEKEEGQWKIARISDCVHASTVKD